jgi:arsenite methyltransferase
MDKSRQETIKEAVRAHYTARAVESVGCCGGAGAESKAQAIGYSEQELSCVSTMSGSSLGCGNPLAFSEVQQGQVVLDLGSGLGMDVILAAQRVGQGGKVIGLDMTPEMIDRAKRNAERAGVSEITDFRLGEMEDMPVADESVDWIISNCVVNLSPDKGKVFQEAYRVLKPGGQMLVSDLVSTGLPEELKRDLSSWAQCLGGTVGEAEYLRLVKHVGFEEVQVVDRTDATPSLLGAGCCGGAGDEPGCLRVDSIRVSAVKPVHR